MLFAYEWQYLMRGVKAQGTVKEIQKKEVSGRYGRSQTKTVCVFTYDDNGQETEGRSVISATDKFQPGDKLAIQFIPGTWKARAHRSSKMLFVIILYLFGTGFILARLVVMPWLQKRMKKQRKRKKKKSRRQGPVM